MAGAAITAPMIFVAPAAGFNPRMVPIKSAEVINQGDLVGIDTNGQMVAASKTQGAIVPAQGIAWFPDELGMATSRTGVAGLTVKAAICRRCKLKSATSTLVPSLDQGLRVYLGPVPTSTVSNYTCAKSTTVADHLQTVGWVEDDGTTLEIDVTNTGMGIVYQASASTNIASG